VEFRWLIQEPTVDRAYSLEVRLVVIPYKDSTQIGDLHDQQLTRFSKVDPVLVPVREDPALPRGLLIGDSISVGYTLPVRKLLASKVNVPHIPMGGGNTAKGLRKLDE